MNYKKIAYIAVLFLLGLIIGFVITNHYRQSKDTPVVENIGNRPIVSGKLNGNPTDFAKAGKILFKEDPEGTGLIPFFEYDIQANVAPAVKLVFDPMSYCATGNGSTECMAMSVSFEIPFNNKNAIVEGITINDDQVLVRKLLILEPGQAPLVPSTGHTFISWEQARNFITSCDIKTLMQTHSLDVYLTMKDDTVLRAVEPVIDAVFKVANDARATCGDIPLATE
jgi:hypothetical protein